MSTENPPIPDVIMEETADTPISSPPVGADDSDDILEVQIPGDVEVDISSAVEERDDTFDIINDDVNQDAPASEETTDDDSVPATDIPDASSDEEEGIAYQTDVIDLCGSDVDELQKLIRAEVAAVGGATLDARVQTVGTWENTVMRAILENNPEEERIRKALKQVRDLDGVLPTSILRNDAGKAILRTSEINPKIGKPGEVVTVSGDNALLAFASKFSKRGGGFRVPLYNTGITVDILSPTGTDLQTLLTNCTEIERQLGAENGAHYFTYADQLYKTQIINFIQPLIVNCSYANWLKNGGLWSIMKLPDLINLTMTLAAICYKDGFDGFQTKCTAPRTDENPEGCHHTEIFKANLFDMIITRMSVLSKESIDFMVGARMFKQRATTQQIAKYQEGLGLEGEKITFDNLTFTMRIPTVTEHLEAGSRFLSDVVNEVEGDNSEGQYAHLGFRYMRTLLPWIATMELTGEDGSVLRTSDVRTITRTLEELDLEDRDSKVRNAFIAYIDKVQLTYVGYPSLPCPACGHVTETPSGLLTIDPFSTFFILVFLYLKRAVSETPKV